uniref:Putative LAGLIDADG homing endonuclease n=1 Tax=Bulbochaete rectangularis var. hiloensis TaxID=55990 RepID=A0A6M4SP35_9CHLO|nr:putative LAGLIDADG homing endonuclease [Bulbochaete rectangularis var. hiloensis]
MLSLLFNNHLVLSHRIQQLSCWIQSLQSRNYWQYDPCQKIPINITLNNSWLSGFIDAEGCFNVYIVKRAASQNGHRIRLRFILDQKQAKNELIFIRNFLGTGFVSLRSNKNKKYIIDIFLILL